MFAHIMKMVNEMGRQVIYSWYESLMSVEMVWGHRWSTDYHELP